MRGKENYRNNKYEGNVLRKNIEPCLGLKQRCHVGHHLPHLVGVVVGDAPHVDSEADQVQLRLRQLRGEKGGAQPVREGEALEEEETQANLPTLAQ